MSIIDETLKKLGGEPPPEEVSFFPQKKNDAYSIPDYGFVTGSRKQEPISFLLSIALVGVVAYFLLSSETFPRKPQPKNSVAAMQAVPPPEWYKAGWKAARAGKQNAALALWEEGVRGLSIDHKVIVSNSYSSLNNFLPVLKRHARMFPAIGVRQHFGGRVLYSVIAFPYGGGTSEVLPKVQNLFLLAWLSDASHVQKHMTGSSAPIVTNGYDKCATSKNETRHARFPHPCSLGETVSHFTKQQTTSAKSLIIPGDEGGNISLREFNVKPARKMIREQYGNQDPPVEQKPPTEQKPPIEQKPPEEKLEAISKVTAERVVAPGAGDWEIRSAAVREQLKTEDYAGVGKNAQMLTHDFPERWESWFWLGTAQLVQGNTGAAETALERASKLNPKVAQIWVQRAIVAQERGNHTTAVKLLNEARELTPKSPQIFLNLGYSNDALGLTAEADMSYLRFLSLTDGDSSYAKERKPVMDRMESRH